MRWSGRLGAAVVISLLMGAGAACTKSEPAVLRVEVSGLPAGTAAQVTVTGPGGSYAITATDERRVSPGAFRLAIASITVGNTAYYPSQDQTEITVPKGQKVTTAAAYRIAIPDTTKVLDPANTGIAEIRPSAVVFQAGTPQIAKLKPGDHLIAGEGPQTKGVLVRRVTSITTSANRTVVATKPATLSEALPAGVVEFDAMQGLQILRPSSSSASGLDDPLVAFEFALKIKEGTCRLKDSSPSAVTRAGSVKYQLDSISLPISGDFSWGVLPPKVAVSVTAKLSVKQSLEANISAAISCSVKAEKDLGAICRKVVGRIVRIGPVSLECVFKIGAKATAETSATWQVGKIVSNPTLEFTAGFSTSDGISSDHHFTAGTRGESLAMPEFTAKVGAEVFLEIGLEGRDPSGTAILSAALNLSAGPSIESSSDGLAAKFQVRPKVVLEAKLDARLREISRDAEIELPKWTLELWKLDRPEPLRQPPPPVPQRLPDRLRLPGDDDPEFGSISSKLTEQWDLAGCAPRTFGSDATRTSMRTVHWGAGDGGRTTQVAVYPDEQAAQRAFAEVRDAAPGCTATNRTATRPVGLGAEGIRYSTFQKYDEPFAGQTDVGTLERLVVVRVDNAVVLGVAFAQAVPSDTISADVNWLISDLSDVVDQLCVAGFRC